MMLDHLRRATLRAILALIPVFGAVDAVAAVTTIDFDDLPPASSQFRNLTVDGFRFSPNCHYDLGSGAAAGSGFNGSQWLGFDRSGCLSHPLTTPFNPQYLGPASVYAALYVDAFGTPFSLESTWLSFSGLQVLSSKGGFFQPAGPLGPGALFDFPGAEWRGIDWLLILFPNDPGAPGGIDHITFRVPEPPAWLLLVGAVLAVRRARRLSE